MPSETGSWARALIALAFLLLPAAGCIRIDGDLPNPFDTEITLVRKGEVVGVAPPGELLRFKTPLPEKDDYSYAPTTFVARVQAPCGSVDLPVEGFVSAPPRRAVLTVKAPALKLWIDNRQGAAATVSLGRLPVAVAAGQTRGWRLPLPKCQAGWEVKVDGKSLGRLPQPDEKLIERPGATLDPNAHVAHYLVDRTAQRCYRWQEVFYSDIPLASEPDFKRLPPRALHQIPPTHFFFEPVPAFKKQFERCSVACGALSECLRPPAP